MTQTVTTEQLARLYAARNDAKPAAWLEHKLDDREWSRLQEEAIQHLEEVDV